MGVDFMQKMAGLRKSWLQATAGAGWRGCYRNT